MRAIMPLVPGTRLGAYEIVDLAGTGGMGEVYRARDIRLNRTVALKLLPTGADASFRARFEREARAVSAIDHPNICSLYDIGSDGDVAYMVMPFIEGETLAERLRRGALPTDEALAIGRQIAAALEAAHGRGFVHRDLKPANVIVTASRIAKVLDFGIAKPIAAEELASGTTSITSSSTGVMVGTLPYMSPEQVRGAAVDTRTDIWGFGCLLFEMLSGRRAFHAATAPDLVAAILSAEPDWTALPARIPLSIVRLVRRCLRKDPTARLRDIGDARIELDEALSGSDRSESAVAPIPRRWPQAVVPWTIAAVATAVALFALFPRQRNPEQMRFSAVTNFPGVEGAPTLAPDGRSVAFVSNRDGQWDIYVGLIGGGSFVRVTNDTAMEQGPRWSPDGSRLLFARLNDGGGTDLWTVPALGGVERRLVPDAGDPAWAPDGRAIAYTSRGAIWIADADGANRRVVSHADPPLTCRQPAFARGGGMIAFVRRRGGPYGSLAIVDLADGHVRDVVDDKFLALSPVWSRDDRYIYFSSSRGGTVNLWKAPVSGGSLEQITAGVGEDTDLDLTADGSSLVYATYRINVDLAVRTLDGGGEATQWVTTDSVRSELAPRYSPDGTKIAFFASRAGSENEGIWIMNADGSNPTALLADGRRNVFPRWTPDGAAIVYASAPNMAGADSELRQASLNAAGVQTLPGRPWVSPWGDISRDGRLLIPTSPTGGRIIDPRSNATIEIKELRADPSAGAPSWSPDGTRFAFAVKPDPDRPADDGIWVGTPAGDRRHLFSGWVSWFAWASDDQLLVLEGTSSLEGHMWRVTIDGQRTLAFDHVPLRVPYALSNTPTTRFDVSRDGRHVVIEALRVFESDLTLIQHVR
jgi:Tol biopolymer transport system component